MKFISLLISELNNLVEIILKNNKIGENENDIKLLFLSLKKNLKIKNLDISYNKIGLFEKNLEFLGKILYENLTIMNLNLSLNDLFLIKNEEILRFFFEFSLNNEKNNLKKLNLSHNKLGENINSIIFLTKGIKFNNVLLKLNLRGNSIGSNLTCVKLISEIIESNKVLNNLNLSHNLISDFDLIKESLMINKSIIKLNFGFNLLGDNSPNLINISELISNNKILKRINLCSNELIKNKIETFEFLKKSIEENNTLEDLILTHNYLDYYQEILDLIKDAKKLNKNCIDIHY
jgi:hypothetical protein